ncbi:MAG: DNA-3-methyladenine glycosylase I [Gammaproteobacteria bacterium]|jgi:DNA-3-methyladenine glycosylase I|nr:DNA-3-methyladenine glycosylase I [Gammaproteobacteria bacterium]
MTDRIRCDWAGNDPLYQHYHDREWGRPSHDDRHLFEMLILEGAQAGLNWITILRKREGYRRAFNDFDAEKIARYTPAKIEKLMLNPDIVRNRLKINAAITNAQCYLDVVREYGSFDRYIWQFVEGKPVINKWKTQKQVPSMTAQSDAMSRALKKRGFKFVGSTICYAYMQAVGMVNDHLTGCFCYKKSR